MKFTVKELASKINISEGTIRSWIMKPEASKVYSADNINYTNLYEKLHKYYEKEAEFEKLAGCKVEDVEIVKAERTTKSWVSVDELKKGKLYYIHNYSLKTRVVFLGAHEINETRTLYLFETMDKAGYKAYDKEQLDVENIKLERI